MTRNIVVLAALTAAIFAGAPAQAQFDQSRAQEKAIDINVEQALQRAREARARGGQTAETNRTVTEACAQPYDPRSEAGRELAAICANREFPSQRRRN
jgi:hypothetical protein